MLGMWMGGCDGGEVFLCRAPSLQIVAQSACVDTGEAWTVGSFSKVAFSLM